MKAVILIPVALLLFSTSLLAVNSTPVNYSWSDYDDWYYKKSASYKGWKYIIIHHSATKAGSVKAFHKFHTRQGYGGIAYHFVIGNGNGMDDGEVKETFRWKEKISGTHVSVNSWEHNIFGIGICLVGNLENNPPTRAQLAALKKLIVKLKKNHKIADKNIIGHKHVKYDDASNKKEQTVCPGKKLELNKLKHLH
ncbi:MAG: peptidoglycan recognition protein family protein [Gammaproteobacteria bacterium]|nr:peptidoglycan recognition protein family protein [Gammaproteobacteria bacterium]